MIRIIKECLANLAKKPFTRNYPREAVDVPECFRGLHSYDRDKCIACGLCERVCPTDAIKVDRVKRRITINIGRCIFCGYCQDICPKGAIKLTKRFEIIKTNEEKNFSSR